METQGTTSSAYRILMGLISLTAPPPPEPTVTIADFFFARPQNLNSCEPGVQVISTNATSLLANLYQSSGSEDRDFTQIASISETPTGDQTVFYFNTTIADRWYYWVVTVSNDQGSAQATSIHLQNKAFEGTISLSPTSLVGYGTTSAYPNTIATLTNWVGSLYWSCYQFVDGVNDIEIDFGEIESPSSEQAIGSTAYTQIGAQFYFAAGNPAVNDTSTLSSPNNGEV